MVVHANETIVVGVRVPLRDACVRASNTVRSLVQRGSFLFVDIRPSGLLL